MGEVLVKHNNDLNNVEKLKYLSSVHRPIQNSNTSGIEKDAPAICATIYTKATAIKMIYHQTKCLFL